MSSLKSTNQYRFLHLLTGIVGTALLFGISPAVVQAELVLVSESFSGAGTAPLNGTSADFFHSGIVAAGGNSTWFARTGSMQFNADGSISTAGTFDGTAFLQMGDYIDNAKGTAQGLFALELTIGDVTTGNWVGVGFQNTDNPSVTTMFADFNPGIGSGDTGLAWAGHNNSPDVGFFFAGPGDNGDSVPTGTNVPLTAGSHTFTVFLDLRTHNGVDEFGTVSYAIDGTLVPSSVFSFTEDHAFRTISIAQDNGGNGTLSNFSLTSVPEPGMTGLLLAASVAFAGRRQRRIA